MSTTTIQINEETLELLKKCKNNFKAGSYNEVINTLLKGGAKRSLYGAMGKERSMKKILKGLRDERDR